MKTVDTLRTLFQKIDNAKTPFEIEVLGIEIGKIIDKNGQKPIEGISLFLLERGNILKQKMI